MVAIDTIDYFDNEGRCIDFKIQHNEPEECPQCKKGIKPNFLYGYTKGFPGPFYILYECNACHHAFLKSSILIQAHGALLEDTEFAQLDPESYIRTTFSEYINKVSKSFVDIYNQAKEAENRDLSEIAGMGYRKALEFLIKDYLCENISDEEERKKIQKKNLSNCINEDVKNENVKVCAEKAAWIGNDETHYVRRHEDKDIKDLKKLIDVTVLWIEMELITEDAKGIPKK